MIAVPLTGCSAGYYTLPVTIGASGTFQLVLDTASTTMGVASSTCASCVDGGVSPLYTPKPPAVDGHRTVSSRFNTAYWSGKLYEDAVNVGPTHGAMNFVAIETQDQFFIPFTCGSTAVPYQGLLGFARQGAAVEGTTGYFDQLAASHSVPNIFATQLCDTGGTLWLGGYDPALVTGPARYVPMSTVGVAGAEFYALDLEEVAFEGTAVGVPTDKYNDSILDTGTNGFLLPPAAFSAVAEGIAKNAAFKRLLGEQASASWFSLSSECAALTPTKAELDAILPPITLVFGSGPDSIAITARATESYLVPTGPGSWCPGLFSWTPPAGLPFASILGSPVLRSSVVIFDRENERLGFAPHKPCPPM